MIVGIHDETLRLGKFISLYLPYYQYFIDMVMDKVFQKYL